MTAAGWRVTLYDPIWHVISVSGVVISRTVISIPSPLPFVVVTRHPLPGQLSSQCDVLHVSLWSWPDGPVSDTVFFRHQDRLQCTYSEPHYRRGQLGRRSSGN